MLLIARISPARHRQPELRFYLLAAILTPGRSVASLTGSSTTASWKTPLRFRAWREDLARLLDGLDVFFVGVHCELAEIDRRERDRGDRRVGECRSHVETDLIHTFGPYDFEVDTTNAVPSAVAASVLAAWRTRVPRRALRQGETGNRGTLFVPAPTALVAAE